MEGKEGRRGVEGQGRLRGGGEGSNWSGQYGRRDETRPVSTGGGTRRVQLVRERGGGKGRELASEQSRSTAKVDEESIQRSVT